LLAVGLLVACAQPTAEPAPAEPVEPAQPAEPAPTAEVAQPAEPAEPSTLTVLEWAYYEVPEMWVEFGEQYPDVEVTFNFGASDPDIFAKTLAGSGEDIMHLYTPYLQFYVDEGLVQPIDTSKMENWDKVAAGFAESCTVDGVVYCVPWDWGFTSILYRTDMIPEGVESWSALFDEAYAGHVSMWDDGPGAVTVASYALGLDERDLTEEQLATIKQMWIDQRNLNLFYWTDEPSLETAMTSGEVWLAYAWNGAYYRLLSAGVPVAYANPTEGRNSWIGQYAISATTENYDLALAFLDGKLGEQTATHLLVDYAYGHVVPDYFSVVEDANLIEALSLDDPTILDRTNFTLPISAAQRDRFVQLWAEVKAAP
jgi:spermidine/putrescine transport system substrate-binding protein